jgi:glyoxylase-like metal-dependent hydrolase (beta-lactamase superfamily II)
LKRFSLDEGNMLQEIEIINLGGVNCYLVKTGDGFILIDTGVSNRRTDLEKALASAGCKPGNLKLVILTHGDSDHADNCAYLRGKYGTKIALHYDDSGMVERGDMSWNRKAKPDKISIMGRIISFVTPFVVRPGKFDTFKPDFAIDESFDLSEYGFNATVLHLPGHSKGSIGILTAGGDLFCGDLLSNIGKPSCLFIDDMADFNASVEKLESLGINTVYPGHGKPFPMELFMKNYR